MAKKQSDENNKKSGCILIPMLGGTIGGLIVIAACCFAVLVFATSTEDNTSDEVSSSLAERPTRRPATQRPTATINTARLPVVSATPRVTATERNTAGESDTTPTNVAISRRDDSRLVIIENVPISGGVEVFPLPDRSSGRLFAAVSEFAPHVAGISEDGDWLLVVYFQGGIRSGWAPARNLTLSDAQLGRLAVIDPDNPPDLPAMEFNDLASRPFGVSNDPAAPSAPSSTAVVDTAPPAAAAPVQASSSGQSSASGGGGSGSGSTNSGAVPAAPVGPTAPAYSCDCNRVCGVMSCQEAYFQLNQCGCGNRDSDGDGVPCESVCPGG